jgi:hypothetical protein
MPPERSMTARVRGGKLDPQHDRCIHYILSCIHSFIHTHSTYHKQMQIHPKNVYLVASRSSHAKVRKRNPF